MLRVARTSVISIHHSCFSPLPFFALVTLITAPQRSCIMGSACSGGANRQRSNEGEMECTNRVAASSLDEPPQQSAPVAQRRLQPCICNFISLKSPHRDVNLPPFAPLSRCQSEATAEVIPIIPNGSPGCAPNDVPAKLAIATDCDSCVYPFVESDTDSSYSNSGEIVKREK